MRTIHVGMIIAIILMSSSIVNGSTHGDNGILMNCSLNRSIRKPLRGYFCSINVAKIAPYDRWLVLPYLIEEEILPVTSISYLESDINDQGVLWFSFMRSDISFNAIPIPAGTQLDVKHWEQLSGGRSTVIKAWLGVDLPMTSGGSLTDVINQLMDQEGKMNRITRSVEWVAPPGTGVLFDPKGISARQSKIIITEKNTNKIDLSRNLFYRIASFENMK